jgi:hypothetical protein
VGQGRVRTARALQRHRRRHRTLPSAKRLDIQGLRAVVINHLTGHHRVATMSARIDAKADGA